jgi:hypothetical protein
MFLRLTNVPPFPRRDQGSREARCEMRDAELGDEVGIFHGFEFAEASC